MDLSKIAPILVEAVKKSLKEKRYPFGAGKYKGIGNKVASGKLYNSVSAQIKKTNEGGAIQISMEQYGPFVQSGRAPGRKGVPISAIEKWIKSRGLKGRDKKGKYITNKSFAFAIRQNIIKFGIKPANFIDIAVEDLMKNEEITKLLGDQAFEDLINAIEGI